MDKHFATFLENFGPAFDKRQVPAASIERYRGKLPDQLLAYWEEHGWSGYADGLFWTVNPEDYEPVVDAWLGDTGYVKIDQFHIIARSAFGELFFWGEKTGDTLVLFTPGSYCVPANHILYAEVMDKGVREFFASLSREDCDFEDLFAPAREKFGRLEHDEMYGFVPALAIGGGANVRCLEKVKAVEHLVILAQFAPLEVVSNW